MFALLLWACVAGDCRVYPVATGFTSVPACMANRDALTAGWLALHPEHKLRDGTRPICANNAAWLLHRFGA